VAIDTNGFTPKRYTEIFDEINADIKARVGTNIDTTANSVFGHLHSNLALSLAQLWDLAQDVYSSNDILAAEGRSLDNLALYNGITREPAKKSRGVVNFVGRDGTSIPLDSKILSVRGDEFLVDNTLLISAQNCVELRVYPVIVQNNTNYTIIVDDVSYSFTTDATATEEEIIAEIESKLAVDGSITTTQLIHPSDPSLSYLLISRIDQSSTMSIRGTSYLTFDYVVTPATVSSVKFGSVPGDALAINAISSGVGGWYSVYNPSDFTLGDIAESDTELRTRLINSYRTTGSGSYDTIGSAVKSIDGVEAVFLRENPTSVTDADGVPPYSFETIVFGGLDSIIADTLWKVKPISKAAHGTTTVNVKDFNGYTKQVSFTRPTERYVFIDVRYTPYTEEDIPEGAVDSAKAAILRYAADSITINTDIIANRFMGSVYSASTGFGDITIEVAATASPTTIPSYPAEYSEVITISDSEIASFALDRMTFTQV
jgi:uncharacterized phage protein gp47/JayE